MSFIKIAAVSLRLFVQLLETFSASMIKIILMYYSIYEY